MPVERELWERELGRMALKAIEDIQGGEVLVPAVEAAAAGLLETIRGILDDGDLSDFDCVEEIASAMARAGISTSRHDFG